MMRGHAACSPGGGAACPTVLIPGAPTGGGSVLSREGADVNPAQEAKGSGSASRSSPKISGILATAKPFGLQLKPLELSIASDHTWESDVSRL